MIRCGATLALLGLASAACTPEEPRVAPPNILVVVIDTLRADRLALYGGERAETPFLDSLAAESLIFDDAWSTSSWTAPATASLFTSLYPSQHGVLTGLRVASHQGQEGEPVLLNRIPASVETLPEFLRGQGYRTFAAVDNPTVCAEMGFTRGFDRFVGFDYAGAEALVDAIRPWRTEMEKAQPFFLYLHFMDPHGPYHPRAPWFEPTGDLWERVVAEIGHAPAALDARETELMEALGFSASAGADAPAALTEVWELVREAYDSEISWLDQRLQDAFAALPIDGKTLIVFTADHGEEFGERGRLGHGYQVHDELVHVPLLLRLPAATRRVGRVAGGSSLVDVLPTLRAALGAQPSGADVGRNLLDAAPSERTLVAERHREGTPPPGTDSRTDNRARLLGSKIAIRRGRWKAVLEEPGGAALLFDMESDPGETTDLAIEQAAALATLRAELEGTREAWLQYEREFTQTDGLGDSERAVLERLGYVEDDEEQ